MVFILEGPDCSGKSTCFGRLKEVYSGQAIFTKESYTPSVPERVGRVSKLLKLVNQGKWTVVMDRATLIDDFVYSPTIGNETPALAGLEGIAKAILADAVVIYFDASPEVLAERLRSRKDEYVSTVEELQAIQHRYETLFADFEISPHRIDTSNLSPEDVFQKVRTLVFPKRFKVAHIVPVGSLDVLTDRGYLMCLANLADKDQAYAQFYRTSAARADQYVLMDNGAAEGDQLTVSQLLQVYDYIRPDEIVLPDTLCNGPETLEKTFAAIPLFKQHAGFEAKLMAVPQGRTLKEWAWCADKMIANRDIDSIGISKFLQMETGIRDIRLQAAEIVQELRLKYDRTDLEVHLLGLSESPDLIYRIAREYPFVRGCDSAYGYLAAQANAPVYGSMERPAGEIDFLHGPRQPSLPSVLGALEIEIGAFYNGPDRSWSAPNKKAGN